MDGQVTSTRYRTVAAALYHACELGGGVVTIDKGEYEEETTLFVGGKITIRPKDGARVVIRGPKGKTVMQCQDPEAKVLVVGIEFVRVGKKGEQGPAVHVEAVEWNSCLRVSCGVVRLSDCKVSGEGCVGILCGRGGLAQLISCKVIKCGSDGVAAADGGMVVANRTLFSRCADQSPCPECGLCPLEHAQGEHFSCGARSKCVSLNSPVPFLKNMTRLVSDAAEMGTMGVAHRAKGPRCAFR